MHLRPTGGELTAGAFGERLHADRGEHVVGDPQVTSCVDASTLAA
jgi:hypothetical protein